MTTTAAPGTPARTPARTPAPSAVAESRPSGFRTAVVLAVLLTVPAVYLVARGELSAHDALVRFGCAWAFATAGVALVLSTVAGGSTAVPADADASDGGASDADASDGGAADGSGEHPTAEAGDGDSAAAYPDPGAGARQD